ncbi:HAD-IIIA family hydrolase [Candidatus Thioglobus sp.]|nr:HAD-IIIA family hydrolase [Candidatus Thioglobus sp.]
MHSNEKVSEIAKKIKLLIIDVDGVLTDGGIYFDDNGVEQKKFDSQDGLGIKLLQLSGIEVAVITARSTKSVDHRLKGLGVEHYYHGILDKSIALEKLIKKLSIDPSESAYVGDDVIDLPVMTRVALPIAVANAQESVKDHALMITEKSGGYGAVREVCNFLLKSQDKYDALVNSFLK